MATYPDFVAGGIMAVITVFVAFGIKTSTIINIIMTTGNALIFGFVMGECKYSLNRGTSFRFKAIHNFGYNLHNCVTH